MLETDFKQTVRSITTNAILSDSYWNEIALQHSYKSRHYHSLKHLQSIREQLQPVKEKIEDWPAMLFAIVYHDFVYDVQKSDNEEKSAEKATDRMLVISFENERIDRCCHHIIATKGHTISEDPDTNYFTDADLSILGSDPDTYKIYTESIRKEYHIYPSFMYKPGRKKVLQHFLHLPQIYKTAHFHQLYEEQARRNLEQEMMSL